MRPHRSWEAVVKAWEEARNERTRRMARPTLCPHCLSPVLTGPDADRAAIPTTVNPNPVTRPARAGDYTLHNGELHYLDQARPDRTPVWERHTCPGPA